MKTAYEWFEHFEGKFKDMKIMMFFKELDKMLQEVEEEVLELALDRKGVTSGCITNEGMEPIIKEINLKWNEMSDLFFEYHKVDIPKDMVMAHLEGCDEKKCKRLIGNLERKNEKGGA